MSATHTAGFEEECNMLFGQVRVVAVVCTNICLVWVARPSLDQ
jgi:hypothetical protein